MGLFSGIHVTLCPMTKRSNQILEENIRRDSIYPLAVHIYACLTFGSGTLRFVNDFPYVLSAMCNDVYMYMSTSCTLYTITVRFLVRTSIAVLRHSAL